MTVSYSRDGRGQKIIVGSVKGILDEANSKILAIENAELKIMLCFDYIYR